MIEPFFRLLYFSISWSIVGFQQQPPLSSSIQQWNNKYIQVLQPRNVYLHPAALECHCLDFPCTWMVTLKETADCDRLPDAEGSQPPTKADLNSPNTSHPQHNNDTPLAELFTDLEKGGIIRWGSLCAYKVHLNSGD